MRPATIIAVLVGVGTVTVIGAGWPGTARSSINADVSPQRVRALEEELSRAGEHIETLWAERERLARDNAVLRAAEAEAQARYSALASRLDREQALRTPAAVGRVPEPRPGSRREPGTAMAPPMLQGGVAPPVLLGGVAPPVLQGGMAAPVRPLVLSSPFGPRGKRFHHGIDLRAPLGTPVFAARAGRVAAVFRKRDLGLTVEIEHEGGYVTRYAHLSAAAVAEGAVLAEGEQIGRTGRSGRTTGPHLHFGVEYQGRTVDPLPLIESGPLATAAGSRS